MLVRPLMTDSKMTVREDCAVSACNPFPHSIYKSSHPLLVGAGSQSLDRYPPPSPSQLAASEIKQTFLSTNLACLLTFEGQAPNSTHTYSFNKSR